MSFEETVLQELRAIRTCVDALAAAVVEDDEPHCPNCGGDELEDTPTAAAPQRQTCIGENGCGRSFNPEVSADG